MSENKSSTLNNAKIADILFKFYSSQILEAKDFVTVVEIATPIVIWLFRNTAIETDQVEIESGSKTKNKNRRKKK